MSTGRHEWFLNQVFRYRPLLQRYLRKFLSNPEDIEDVIQETYLRVYTCQDYEAIASPKSLLLKISHNLAVDLIRRRDGQATEPMADLDDADVSPVQATDLDDQVDARQRFEAFCSAVDSLPAICRRAFVLKKVYKLSQAEISTILGVSENTVEKHVAKGLIRCRDYFRERGMMTGGEKAISTRVISREQGK